MGPPWNKRPSIQQDYSFINNAPSFHSARLFISSSSSCQKRHLIYIIPQHPTRYNGYRSASQPRDPLAPLTSPGKANNEQLKSTDLFDVSFVTALVTGGATGIGLMISQALVANGAKVYITGRRQEVLDKSVKTYGDGPGSLHAIQGDVSTKDGCIKLAKEIEGMEPDGIQLLVNSAGIARDDNTQFCTLKIYTFHNVASTDEEQRRTANQT